MKIKCEVRFLILYPILIVPKVAYALEEEKKRKIIAAEHEARRQEIEKQRKKQQMPQRDTAHVHVDEIVSDVMTDPIVTLDSIVYPDADNSLSTHKRLDQPSAPSPEPERNSYPGVPDVSNQSSPVPR